MTQPLNYASTTTERSLRRPKLNVALRVLGLLLFAPGPATVCALGCTILFDEVRPHANEEVVFCTMVIPFALAFGLLSWRLQGRRWFDIACVAVGTLAIVPGSWIAYNAYVTQTWLWEIEASVGLAIAGLGMAVAISGLLGFARRRYCEW